MRVSTINSFPKFQSVTEEHRKPAVEQPHLPETHHHKAVNPASVTGWGGVIALGVAILSGIKRMPTLHKTAAFVGAALIAGHIGTITAFHRAHHHGEQRDNERLA